MTKNNITEHGVDNVLEDVYQHLSQWLTSFEQHEVIELIDIIEKAKQYLYATEQIPEQQVVQFVDNLQYDLKDFYQAYQQQAQSSWYLTLLKEQFWQLLAQMTDKTQIEWQELVQDFNHHGEYCSGDFVGFGRYLCQQCQQSITITHPSRLSECSYCNGKRFVRQSIEP